MMFERRPMRFELEMAALGGIARRSDLRWIGLDDDELLRIMVRGGRRLIRVRQAWYALPDADPDAVRACRMGGRLACASALRFHGVPVDDDGILHVEMPANAVVRVSEGERATVRLHWPRRPSSGDRAAVDLEAACRQWRRCGDTGRRGIRSTR